MVKLETYWCEDVPTQKDIEYAFKRVNLGAVVSIRWFVEYNGMHEKIITFDTILNYTPEEYFNNVIPHMYGV